MADHVQSMHDRVENDFTLHPPVSPENAAQMDAVRAAYKELAHFVVDAVPGSREQSSALTALEESCFHALGAIARNQ